MVEPATAALTAPWWRRFADPDLEVLIEAALEANLELGALASRIEQAALAARQAGGVLFPSIDGFAEYGEEWRENESRSRSSAIGSLLSWELDVWGRLRSAHRAGELDTEAAYEDWQDARRLLSAAVAELHFEALEARHQLALLAAQIEANTTLLDLTRLRFAQGQASIVDVLQQREQLASTRARVPDVEARLERVELALDVLLARAPGERPRVTSRALADPPALPALGVPSDLLARRSDLRAAARRVAALDYRVASAIADRLPRISIGASFEGGGAPGIDRLVGSALSGLLVPVFDGGSRKAEVDIRRARLEEALFSYSQAYLDAVREVEAAVVSVRRQAERVRRLEEELAIAVDLLSETRNRYAQGLTDYLPVLNAVVTVQELEREVVTSRREHLSFHVAVHRALGGALPEMELP